MTEVELELRLDPEGRTAFDTSKLVVEGQGEVANNEELEHADAKSSSITDQGRKNSLQMDYSSKTILTSLADEAESTLFNNETEKKNEFFDELLFDCEITDCALLPRTFWMPATGMKPRCALEQCALEVFQHHVKDGVVFDPKTSGAEWWVQIRPSPQAGRYNLLSDDASAALGNGNEDESKNKAPNKNKNDDDKNRVDGGDLEKTGICFHWDKDEDLRIMMGGNMYIHPHISTVTYLSDSGAPTMALNYRVNNFTGVYESPPAPESVDAYLSWPKRGKHLSFDGRFLHAAPCNLMKKGEWEKQISLPDHGSTKVDKKEEKKLLRRRRRTTFLVNVWLNYKPFNVNTFPESMMDKMSKPHDERILLKRPSGSDNEKETSGKPVTLFTHEGASTTSKQDAEYVTFKWPMGACGSKESIVMDLPLNKIQDEMQNGGNIRMKWACTVDKDRGIRIQTGENENDTCQKRQKLE